MSDLGDLLELLHGASERWRTVRTTIWSWRHHGRHMAAWHAWQQNAGGSVTTFGIAASGNDEPEPETSQSQTKLWIDGERVREEHEGDLFPRHGVRAGELWWSYDEHNGAMSNEEAPEVGSGIGEQFRYLFDPASIIGGLRFQPVGRTRIADRTGISVHAVARETDDPYWALRHLPHGADDYELVVDDERGVVLRLAARFGGDDFVIVELADVAFDEEFPPETFVFEPPPGERIRSPHSLWMTRDLTIEETQREAPFTVWVPSSLEPGWEMTVHYSPGNDRRPTPASVMIHYNRRDTTHQFSIHEIATGEPDEFAGNWEQREHAGGQILVWAAERDAPSGRQTRVRVARDGTQITVHSSDMELEQLLALLDLLVPAPTDPPPLARGD